MAGDGEDGEEVCTPSPIPLCTHSEEAWNIRLCKKRNFTLGLAKPFQQKTFFATMYLLFIFLIDVFIYCLQALIRLFNKVV